MILAESTLSRRRATATQLGVVFRSLVMPAMCTAGVLLTFLFTASPAGAQDSGLSFLRVGVNAEAGAMGDAHVARSRDAFSTYWNPAGLPAAEVNSAALSYYRWILDTGTYSAAARFRAGERGGLGIFATAMGSGDLEARQEPGDPDGTFGVQFISTGLSYGYQFGPVRAGVTAKYLSERIQNRSSNGYAFDFGLQSDVLDGGVHLGAVVQNIGEMNELVQEATRLPRAYRAGIGIYPFDVLLSEDSAMLLETLLIGQISHFPEAGRTQIHVGVSVAVLETIDVRAGYIANDALRSFSVGTGFDYEGFIFDYAFLPFESGFGGPGHLLTFGYAW